MSGCATLLGLLVRLVLLILGLVGARGRIAIGGIMVLLAIATWAIARRLHR